ncbi:apoptosis regulator R1-like [Centruroides sculpturatus]|uniref:apoptosis regulator R1-like n=1 Tax=Centruroides sculpturatus TaxID=218467 RepID=UPI000C6D79C5|nr:apoptosis regulator R1-like [Centruroides sculpturatus]
MNVYKWRSPTATLNEVNRAIRSLGNKIKTEYRVRILEAPANLNVHFACVTFLEVVSELFNDGINWFKIVALFVITSDMALICYRINNPELVKHIAESLSWYIETKLLIWVRNNDNWNGLVAFQEDI